MIRHSSTHRPESAAELSFTIRPGQRWRHHRGGLYVVLSLALDEATLTWRVHYRAPEGGPCWSRPLAEWLGMADDSGRLVPRYALEEAAP